MSDGSLDISEILREVRDELRENNKRIAEINTRLAVFDAYNIPELSVKVQEHRTAISTIETKLRIWASGAAVVGMFLSLIVQEAFKSIWPSSH